MKTEKTVTTLLLILLLTEFGMACRYTVREIGFADFGKDSYQLVLFRDDRISDSEAVRFKKISSAALLDANIAVKVIDVNRENSSPLLAYYNKSAKGAIPDFILVSPEGRTKAFHLESDENFSQAVWKILENIVTSPVREKLKEHIITSYGVVVMVEGKDSRENIKASKIIEDALEEIRLLMHSLPKPVTIPPVVVTIKAGEISAENILLWSLGWQAGDISKPAVALLYGRGRRMGPILKGEYIKEDIVKNMLRFIGEDCECGLDRNWMLGTMIPLRWDSKLKAGVLTHYGFDADNPLVISEMSQILSIAPQRVNSSVDTDLLYGYTESILTLADSTTNRTEEPSVTEQDESFFGIQEALSYTVLTLLLVVIISGFVFIGVKRGKFSP